MNAQFTGGEFRECTIRPESHYANCTSCVVSYTSRVYDRRRGRCLPTAIPGKGMSVRRVRIPRCSGLPERQIRAVKGMGAPVRHRHSSHKPRFARISHAKSDCGARLTRASTRACCTNMTQRMQLKDRSASGPTQAAVLSLIGIRGAFVGGSISSLEEIDLKQSMKPTTASAGTLRALRRKPRNLSFMECKKVAV